MDLFIYIAFVLLLGILTVSIKQDTWKRWIITFFCLILVFYTVYTWINTLSLPRPVDLEFRKGQTELIGQYWVEEKAIYLWVVWPNEDYPRYYTMPWSEEKVEELRQALKAKKEIGTEVTVEFNSETNFTSEEKDTNIIQNILDGLLQMPTLETRKTLKFYESPVAADPPKTINEDAIKPKFDFKRN